MNGRWVLALVLFLATCSLSAFAGSPTIGVLDPTCPDNTPSANQYFYPSGGGSNVTFDTFASINGGGVFAFCNGGPGTWDTVDFVTSNFGDFATGSWTFDANTTPSGSPILCNAGGSGEPFLSCTITISLDKILMEFTDQGSKNANGIQTNHWMVVTLNDNYATDPNSDSGSWIGSNGGPILIGGGANVTDPGSLTPPVPEPASLILLGSGILAALSWKRKNRRL